ncbi:MAG: N-6 DNA methylase [Candidatus Micrarchaeota archaeon]
MDKESLLKEIQFLSEDFIKNQNQPKSERDVCRVYIEPLFSQLGWNFRDLNEVKEQVNQPDGRPDYIFYLNGNISFFLETKKVQELTEKDLKQAVNYGRAKNKRWAVLSNFKETIILICDTKETSILKHVFRRFPYSELQHRLDDLLLISKEAFQTDLIEKKAQDEGRVKKTVKIDDELLNDIWGWHQRLKSSIKNNNSKDYSKEELEEIVQTLLDRIIFIRTAEDRKHEAKPDETILAILNQYEKDKSISIMECLKKLFKEYDLIYDSKLFTYDESNTKIRHECEYVEIDSATYYKILKETYEKDEIYSYKFDDIDADVLGSMYERYIGRLQSTRKEQGIYYTPTDIVDYIVKNTVGEILKHKKPDDIDTIKVLDMACGSGSFLLKAFDTLDSYYKRKEKDYAQTKLDVENETAKLTRKTKILKNNIYGVDLDLKAVEIAQLNLLLKAAETKHRLPDLRENIKCGNSLIEDQAVAGLRAFDWSKEFSKIIQFDENGKLKDGSGFDVIIGNPPYVRPENMPKNERRYYLESKKYDKFFGRFDLYILFIERALKLLKSGGYFSFIIPFSFLNQNYSKILREWILNDFKIVALIDLSDIKVFEAAAINTCVLVLQKNKPAENNSIKIVKPTSLESLERTNIVSIKQNVFLSTPGCTIRTELNEKKIRLIDKIAHGSVNLSEICYIVIGAVPHDSKTGASKDRLISEKKTSESFKPYIEGKDMSRYSIVWRGLYLNYQPTMMHRPKFPELFENEKLIVRNISTSEGLLAAYDDEHFYTNDTVSLCVPWNSLRNVTIKGEKISDKMFENSAKHSLLYCLALINSRVLNFYFKHILSSNLHVYPEAIRNLPIKTLPSGVRPDHLIELVKDVLSKKKRFEEIGDKNTDERAKLDKEILQINRRIDRLVYGLYGLTEDEIAIIEVGTN